MVVGMLPSDDSIRAVIEAWWQSQPKAKRLKMDVLLADVQKLVSDTEIQARTQGLSSGDIRLQLAIVPSSWTPKTPLAVVMVEVSTANTAHRVFFWPEENDPRGKVDDLIMNNKTYFAGKIGVPGGNPGPVN